jgi:hypothetical protein
MPAILRGLLGLAQSRHHYNQFLLLRSLDHGRTFINLGTMLHDLLSNFLAIVPDSCGQVSKIIKMWGSEWA